MLFARLRSHAHAIVRPSLRCVTASLAAPLGLCTLRWSSSERRAAASLRRRAAAETALELAMLKCQARVELFRERLESHPFMNR